MTATEEIDVAAKLESLRSEFQQKLPGQVVVIGELWQAVIGGTASDTDLKDIHRLAHNMAGSCGTFGMPVIGVLAREIEQDLKIIMLEPNKVAALREKIESSLGQIKSTLTDFVPSNVPYIQQGEQKEARVSNLIYLAEDDDMLAAEIALRLEKEGYNVKHFDDLKGFEKACEIELPVAIIMDVVFKDHDDTGADAIMKLRAKIEVCPPVIFVSVRDDMEARLAAASAGASRYFCKPLDMGKLIKTLDGLTSRSEIMPFRVLLVDDDEILLEYYATVLRDAGIVVSALNNPLDALEVLKEFKPDVVVLDVYMPFCSGPEVAQVIRQDDVWAMMPIMFLSTETDLTFQLESMDLGGDDFLVKPVEANHLIGAVVARAKRSRWTQRLNSDLKIALRESKFQLTTMDEHAIVSEADVTGKITKVNDKLCEVSGYQRKELIGQNHSILKSSIHSKDFFKDLWQTISSGKVWNGIICNQAKDGREYWVESTIVPFLNEKGKPYKYVSARTDITEMRSSQERLHRSQVFANIGNWDWDISKDELHWSESTWPLLGFEGGINKSPGEEFINALHPDDKKEVLDAVDSCVEKGYDYNHEFRVVWPDGTVHWLHDSGNVIRDKEGKPLHMLGVIQNIDKRKQVEVALLDREKKLKDAQTLARFGNWEADIITGDLVWSDEIYRIFGYEPGSFKPSIEAFKKAVHPDDLAAVDASEKASVKSGYHNIVHRIILPNGAIRHVHERAQSELNKSGKIVKLAGTVQDITDRVDAEERFTFAVEGAGDGIWSIDMENGEMEVSPLFLEMLGYKSGELPDNIETWMDYTHPDDIERARGLMRAYLKGEIEKYSVEVRMLCKDGSYKWVQTRGKAVHRSTDGRAMRMAGIQSDISARVALQERESEAHEALIEARDEAEDANRAKSQFLSSMSHELRTPMNAIMGFSQLLKMETDPPLSESQNENVEEITKAGKHLLELINEVLDLARIEAGRIDLSIETVLINEVILDCIQLISPLAQSRNIEINITNNGDAASIDDLGSWREAIRADRVRLKQALLNILSNAVKYNRDDGKIIISCNHVENNVTRLSVTDTGQGLDEEQIEQLFKSFSRLGKENSEIEGTGIGLVITKSLVELMGGNIGVDSVPGEGTTFWVEFSSDEPLSEPDMIDLVDDAKVEVAPETKFKHEVLYIEDNPANLRLVAQLLGRRPNIHLWSAHEPFLGLELAAAHNLDLILLDINLPGMDGFEVMKELRKRDATRNTPVLAISANAMPKDIEKGMAAGFDGYITKPIDVKQLLEAVEAILLAAEHSENTNEKFNEI